MKKFDGKVAAITGAASGMGRTLATALARRGCHLALSDVEENGLAETARLASASGVRITTRRVDVADEAAVRRWADDVAAEHRRCNLVFNNAGIAYAATVRGCEYTDFDRILQVNFWGVVHGTKAFLPHLTASGEGHIVNTSSLFGLVAFPGQCAYNASKFAVRGFTEALRIELEITGAPVSATSVHPGGIKTNIARASKVHPSIRELGVGDHETTSERFEKLFRMTAEDAAEVILRGVQRNARRILVGRDAKLIDLVQRVLPDTYQGVLARIARRTLA
jgi:NAD(P)-dependent dehydrogenase (short-subunit alcohol dehydrogenase family)